MQFLRNIPRVVGSRGLGVLPYTSVFSGQKTSRPLKPQAEIFQGPKSGEYQRSSRARDLSIFRQYYLVSVLEEPLANLRVPVMMSSIRNPGTLRKRYYSGQYQPAGVRFYSDDSSSQSNDENDNSAMSVFLKTIDKSLRISRWKKSYIGTALALLLIAVYKYIQAKLKKSVYKKADNVLGINTPSNNILPEPRQYRSCIERRETVLKLRKRLVHLQKQYNVGLLLIYGKPGSGKSELAEDYADNYTKLLQRRIPQLIRTVKIFKATDKESFFREYTDFAVELGVVTKAGADRTTPQNLIRHVNKKLKQRKHFILIFDDVINLSDIEAYIPTGRKLKGQVILTSRNSFDENADSTLLQEGALCRVNVLAPDYRFSRDEVDLMCELFTNLSSGVRTQTAQNYLLAEKLEYLPHALKKAFCCIRERGITIESYLKEFERENESIQDPNLTVNKLSLTALAKQKSFPIDKAFNLLAFLSLFMNSLKETEVNCELLKNFGSKVLQLEDIEFEKLLDNLERFSLIETRPGNKYKMHSTVARYILDYVPGLQGISINMQPAIRFIINNFLSWNVPQEQRRMNMIFVHHIEELQESLKKYNDMQDCYYLAIPRATFLLTTGKCTEARSVLRENMVNLEALIDTELIENSGDRYAVICRELGAINPNLLTVYAQTLYQLGRTYFKIGPDKGEPDKLYFNYLKAVVKIRDYIDQNKLEKEPIYNRNMADSLIAKSNGTLEYIYRSSQLESEIDQVIEEYNKLMDSLPLSYQTNCKRERYRAKQRKALISKDSRVEDLDQATKELFSGIQIIDSEDKLCIYDTVLEHMNRPHSKTRCKYYNDIGNSLLIRVKIMKRSKQREAFRFLKKAEYSFIRAIEFSRKSGNPLTFDVCNAYLGLSKVLFLQERFQESSSIINKCIRIQKDIKMNDRHWYALEATELKRKLAFSPIVPVHFLSD